jgi:hypothetical protein
VRIGLETDQGARQGEMQDLAPAVFQQRVEDGPAVSKIEHFIAGLTLPEQRRASRQHPRWHLDIMQDPQFIRAEIGAQPSGPSRAVPAGFRRFPESGPVKLHGIP